MIKSANWQREVGRVPGATRYRLLKSENPFVPGRGRDGKETRWRVDRWPLLVRYDDTPNNIRLVQSLDRKATASFFAAQNARKILELLAESSESTSNEAVFRTERLLTAEHYFDPAAIEDTRERAIRELVQRRGQPAFRNELLRAYESRCALTRCDVAEALEAAHISPYLGAESNVIGNGLLLRADIHTLLDLKLISFDPDSLECRIAPPLNDSSYEHLNGVALTLPVRVEDSPSKAALHHHWRSFCESHAVVA